METSTMHDYIINRLDAMDKSNNERFEKVNQAIANLQATVTNGLSDRSRESLRRIQALEDTAATKEDVATIKEDIKQLRTDRDNANVAWEQARRWKIRTVIAIVAVLMSVGTTVVSILFGG